MEKPKVDFITTVQLMKEAALWGPAEFGDALFVDRAAEVRERRSYTEATARDYFILRSITEIQKAGLAISRWVDFAQTVLDGTAKDTLENPVEALRLASFIDEQSLWRRKLVEILVQFVCFSATNTPSYYYHHLLLADLCRCLFDREEQRQFFDSESAALAVDAKLLLAKIAGVEGSGQLDLQRCWYMREPKPLSALQPSQLRPHQVAASIAKQLRVAIAQAVASEKFALGYSYRIAVSDPSEDIHFSPISSDTKSAADRFRFGCVQVGFLAAAILSRAQSLTGVSPTGVASDFVRSCAQRPMPQNTPFFGVAEVGDFVVVTLPAGPFIAQVEEVLANDFGYQRYRVRFLDEKPFGEIEEDWVLPNRVTLYQRRSELVAAVEVQIRANAPEDPTLLASLLALDNLDESTRMAVLETWKLAFRGLYRDAFDKQQNRR